MDIYTPALQPISSMLQRRLFVLYGWSGGSRVIFVFVLNLSHPLGSCTIPFLNVVKAALDACTEPKAWNPATLESTC
jgi:hypothetical protein